jgi:phosphoserine phosphatase
MIEENAFLPEAIEAMRADATEFSISAEGSGAELARRLLEASRAGKFPEERLFEMTAWATAGRTAKEALDLGWALVEQKDVRGRLQPEAVTVARWALARFEVWLVSASPSEVVRPAAFKVGIENVIAAQCETSGHQLIASGLARDEVRFEVLPRVIRPIPYGPAKLTRLRKRIGDRPLLAAFGDSAFDIPLLAAAGIPVAVRPKPALRARAGEVAGLVELERIIA